RTCAKTPIPQTIAQNHNSIFFQREAATAGLMPSTRKKSADTRRPLTNSTSLPHAIGGAASVVDHVPPPLRLSPHSHRAAAATASLTPGSNNIIDTCVGIHA